MMSSRFILVSAFLVGLIAVLPNSARSQTLFMTEIPGETEQNNGGSGVSLEIVRAVFERAGIVWTERFLPWKRAVKSAEKNGFIVPFSRTTQREERFKWIIRIQDFNFAFVSLDQSISSMAEAAEYSKIGVWAGTSMEDELRNNGLENLHAVNNGELLTTLLVKGRIDAWYGSVAEAKYLLANQPREIRSRVRFGKTIETEPVWLASGKSISATEVQNIQNAFAKLREDGTLDKIVSSRDDLFE